MRPYVNYKKNGVLHTTISFSVLYFIEIFAISCVLVKLPEVHREQIINILVLIVICATAYLKLRPNKVGLLMADLMTIVFAAIISLQMTRFDDSFFNVFNVLLALFVVVFMAYCNSKELLNERYKCFIEYVEKDNSDVNKESNSRDKYLRYTTEIARQYIIRVDGKLSDIENYVNYFHIPIDSDKDYKKLSQSYYCLYRFYKNKGFDFRLVRNKKKGHAIKIQWFSQE